MTTTEFLSSDLVQADADVRDANAAKYRRHGGETCFLCGRGLTEQAAANGWWIHLTTGGYLTSDFSETQDFGPYGDSQGCFPVGSECAKRVPLQFRERTTKPSTPKVAKPKPHIVEQRPGSKVWQVEIDGVTHRFTQRGRTFYFDTRFAYTMSEVIAALVAS